VCTVDRFARDHVTVTPLIDSFRELACADDAASPAMVSRLGTIPFQV
jgi:hypothetical protein